MRILNLQNAVLVSLAAATVALGACSSSDTPRPDATAGAAASTAGTGNTTAGDTGNTAGSGNTTSGGGDLGTAGTSPAGGGAGNGTAGAGTGGGTPAGPSVCDGIGSRLLTATDSYIENFETPVAGSTDAMFPGAGWYAFNDLGMPGADSADSSCGADSTGLLSSCAGTGMFKLLRTAGAGAPPTAATAFFGEYMGTGANIPSIDKGASFGVGVEFNVGVAAALMQFCVDASVFTGVSFWAKVGDVKNATVIFDYVVPSQNVPSPASVTAGAPDADCTSKAVGACYNFPQKTFTLTTTWALYNLDFAAAKGSSGATVAGNKIQQIEWLPQTKDWDLSIDEVQFYTGTPSMGPATPPAPAGGSGGSGGGQ